MQAELTNSMPCFSTHPAFMPDTKTDAGQFTAPFRNATEGKISRSGDGWRRKARLWGDGTVGVYVIESLLLRASSLHDPKEYAFRAELKCPGSCLLFVPDH